MDNRFKDNNYLVFNTSIANIVITEENNEIVSINFTKKNIKSSKSALLNNAKLELKEYFNQNRKTFSFDVFPRETPFQYLVWREIKKISYGSTKTYMDLAKILSTSPRAIGNACAQNKCLILIPCHRIVSTTGKLLGFSALGGTKTKKQLITIEK